MNKENLHRITLRIAKNDWELFKKICEAKGTKASVKMRELMKDYIRNNANILNELSKGENK
jgi:hypothetical protein